MERRTKAVISAVVLAVTLVINWMGAVGMINNLSQKEVSDQFPTLITPGPATFSIWGLIYTLLIAAVIIMIVRHKDRYVGQAIDEISTLFWLSSAFNVAWIVTFSYLQMGLSTILILAFVVTLALINQKLHAIQSHKRWLLPLAFGFYGGWLFIATVVNTAAWLVQIEWSRWGLADPVWATIILLVAIVLTALVLSQLRNAVFPLPIAWAYVGIYQALTISSNPEAGQYPMLQITALVGAIALAALALWRFWRNGYTPFPTPSHR